MLGSPLMAMLTNITATRPISANQPLSSASHTYRMGGGMKRRMTLSKKSCFVASCVSGRAHVDSHDAVQGSTQNKSRHNLDQSKIGTVGSRVGWTLGERVSFFHGSALNPTFSCTYPSACTLSPSFSDLVHHVSCRDTFWHIFNLSTGRWPLFLYRANVTSFPV